MNKLKNEPAVITSVLVALVGAAATLGIIGTDQQDQLVAVITAVVPIIGGLIVRASVTPNAKAKGASSGTVYVDVKQALAPADPPADDTAPTPDATPAPEPAPAEPAPVDAPPAPVEDPVKAQLKAAIETVRANSNALNDARAQAAKAAVDASS